VSAAWVAVVGALSLCAGCAAGTIFGLARRRARLIRVSDGIAELARGNLAHRIVLPGSDEAARMAEALNGLADSVQCDQEAAAGRDAAQRRLLANISHDLRTPITAIAGYVDALQRGLGDAPERYLAIIAAKAEDVAQLTDDLFYAARIDAGDLTLKRSRLDLAEALRRSVLGIEPLLASSGVHVTVSVPEEPCPIEADPSAVARILSNLMSNSLRHGESMTVFSVEMVADHGRYVVRVGNDGARLPEDAERFFARGAAGPAGGAGLGLAIARELAERMGAVLYAGTSSSGLVTFTFAMPRA
jgi:signal transduction histidine kinase